MTSRSMLGQGLQLALLCTLILSALGGCQGSGQRNDAGMAPPSIQTLDERQLVRTRKMSELQSGGTLELRTRDENGTTFEECALELWRDDASFALRLRKLGERFLWVGSDGQAWWIFELMADPVRLVVLPPGETGGFSVGPGKGLLNPDRLLHLAGLLPYDRIEEDTLGFDDQGRVRFITVSDSESAWRRTRWHLDPKTLLPAQIVALNDDDGEVLATARLSAYEPIAGRDLPLGAWPQFPRKVYLTLADDGADVRLFFNRPSARGTGIRPRLFDLEQLMKTFRPGEVEYVSR
jgi:hypothetical protein